MGLPYRVPLPLVVIVDECGGTPCQFHQRPRGEWMAPVGMDGTGLYPCPQFVGEVPDPPPGKGKECL